jgi:hypothetical protein
MTTDTTNTSIDSGVTVAHAREIAWDAYIYGFPLADAYRINYAYFDDADSVQVDGAAPKLQRHWAQPMRVMWRIRWAVAVMAVALSGCAGNSGKTTTASSTTTGAATNSTSTATSSPLVPGGWGSTSPDRAATNDMAAWVKGPGSHVGDIIKQGYTGTDQLTDGIKKQDVSAVKDACPSATQPLTIRLPAALPAPDADLTNALQALVDSGRSLEASCGGLTDPPTAEQIGALENSERQLASSLRTAGSIMGRDGDILDNNSGR